MNSIVLTGKLGQDATARYLPDGTMVASFDLPVWVGGEDTEWVQISLWGDLAEKNNLKLVKGQEVVVQANFSKLQVWADKNTGKARGKYSLRAYRIDYVGPKLAAGDAPLVEDSNDDDDVPF